MNLNDITVVMAIDARHLEELQYTWPTWMKFKPEMSALKKIVIYDKNQLTFDKFTIFDGHDIRFIPWDMPGVEQREKMLTSLVKIPATEVTTKWYLKIDVDTIATAPGPWIKDEWFATNPVYIAQGWGFSKPADVLKRLDDWGDTVPEISKFPRLNIPYDPKMSRVFSKRITSWCFFGRTDWTRKIWNLCNGKLPVPSQDTLMYHCAARLGEHTVRTNMRDLGWGHFRLKTLKEMSKELLK